MPFAFLDKTAQPNRIVRSRWIRGTVVMSLAFILSACVYDSPRYRSYGGYSSYQHGYYDRSHMYRGHYSNRPDWRAQARHRQAQRRHRAEAHRSRPHSRGSQVQRQRYFEARKHPGAEHRNRRAYEQRNRVLGSGTAPRRHQ